MNADSIATRRSRRWALLATVAGFFCLLPTAVVTVAWYRHVWHHTWAEFGPTYVRMTALYAAALEPRSFASVKLQNGLISWSDVVRTPLARGQLAGVVHGALRVYDLPDLVATLPAEKVAIVDPLDAQERPVSLKGVLDREI